MSKVLDATYAGGVVKVESLVIQDAIILSLGLAASATGVLIIDSGKSYFIASSALDIKALITSLVGIIDQIALIATGLDAVTTSPGSAAASIAALNSLKVQLDLTKETLI